MQVRHASCAAPDGVALSYKIFGQGPLALVFMHGWGSTKDYFDQTIEAMQPGGLTIVCFDLRGHGDSDAPRGEITVGQLARDMLAVADHAGLGRFVAAGHSMGAKYIQYLPLIAPGRVLGQALIAGTPAGRIDVEEALLQEWAGYAGDRDAMRTSHHSIIRRPVPHAVSEKWVEQAARIEKTVLYDTLKLCFEADFEAELLQLQTLPPTLAIGGGGDPFFSPDFLRQRLVARVPGSRLLVMDCGHEIPIERPQDLAWQLEAFCAGVLPAEQRRQR